VDGSLAVEIKLRFQISPVKFYEKGGQTIVDVENVTCFILVLHEISNKD